MSTVVYNCFFFCPHFLLGCCRYCKSGFVAFSKMIQFYSQLFRVTSRRVLLTSEEKNTLRVIFIDMLRKSQNHYFYGIKHDIRSPSAAHPMGPSHYMTEKDAEVSVQMFDDFLWDFCTFAARRYISSNASPFHDLVTLQLHLERLQSIARLLFYKY